MTPLKGSSIYTLGYSGWDVDDVAALLVRLDAVLVDVRMSPRSRNPDYSGKRLTERLGERYVHVREFGNRNYRGGPIRLVDFPAGERRLRELIGAGPAPSPVEGKAIVLMCACADVKVCHRKVVADRLAELWSAEVVHLAPGDAGPGSPTLFKG